MQQIDLNSCADEVGFPKPTHIHTPIEASCEFSVSLINALRGCVGLITIL